MGKTRLLWVTGGPSIGSIAVPTADVESLREACDAQPDVFWVRPPIWGRVGPFRNRLGLRWALRRLFVVGRSDTVALLGVSGLLVRNIADGELSIVLGGVGHDRQSVELRLRDLRRIVGRARLRRQFWLLDLWPYERDPSDHKLKPAPELTELVKPRDFVIPEITTLIVSLALVDRTHGAARNSLLMTLLDHRLRDDYAFDTDSFFRDVWTAIEDVPNATTDASWHVLGHRATGNAFGGVANSRGFGISRKFRESSFVLELTKDFASPGAANDYGDVPFGDLGAGISDVPDLFDLLGDDSREARKNTDVPIPEKAPPQGDSLKRLYDNVQFTVFRPRAIVGDPARWYTLLCFAHLAERRPDAPAGSPDPVTRVRQEAEAELAGEIDRYRELVADARQAIPEAGEITIVPEVPGLEFNPPSRSFQWREDVHKEVFRFRSVTLRDGSVARGVLTIRLGVVIVASMDLSIAVRAGSEEVQTEAALESCRTYRRIFPSYSHLDRAIVDHIIESARAIGSQYLQDVISLRSGEPWRERLHQMIREADLFQLFWSSNTMRSVNVREEWELALSLRRRGFIRPTYWETPLPRDQLHGLPPPDLEALHFHRVSFPEQLRLPEEPMLRRGETQDEGAQYPPQAECPRAEAPARASESAIWKVLKRARPPRVHCRSPYEEPENIPPGWDLWPHGWMEASDEHGPRLVFDLLEGRADRSLTVTMRWIPPGSFLMGSPQDEPGRLPTEEPQHQVVFGNGYWVFETLCTQAVWEVVMGDNPSRFRDPQRPVENVTWRHARCFVDTLNERCALNFSRVHGRFALLSEAQWEYACRAGTNTALYSGPIDIWELRNAPALDPVAWYGGNTGKDYGLEETFGTSGDLWREMQDDTRPAGTRKVKEKQPNAWGLYDMLGNVWEWTEDHWHDNYEGAPSDGGPWVDSAAADGAPRVIRGGSWRDPAAYCRSAVRGRYHPDDRDDGVGFRCALVQIF